MFHPEEAPVTAGLTTSAKASAVRRSFTRRRKAGRYRAAGEKARVIRELEKMSRPAGDFDPSRYFRGAGDLAFYKVGTTAMRALARQVHANHRDEWSIDDAMALADALIVEPHLERSRSASRSSRATAATSRRGCCRRGNGGLRATTRPTGLPLTASAAR
jgi:hypothetical protein